MWKHGKHLVQHSRGTVENSNVAAEISHQAQWPCDALRLVAQDVRHGPDFLKPEVPSLHDSLRWITRQAKSLNI
jgi:hypothetical protein